MRISSELINDLADQRVDPNGDRALIMRGYKITVIENLAITRDQYACIDLSDNDLGKIENIPTLRRLRTLIFANNSISRIASDAFDGLPELTSLVLSNNRISSLSTLLPIAKLTRLERLSLIDNPVNKQKHYRWFVIHLLGYSWNFRYIDFQRITDLERREAREFFESDEGVQLLRNTVPVTDEHISAMHAKPTVPSKKFAFSEDILQKLGEAITAATDMDTITTLEKALKTGEISDEVARMIGLE
jgi:U2 small nuclear ribonucleoprotein A'